MPRKASTRSGIRPTISQAPSPNLVTATTPSTIVVSTAPTPLSSACPRQPGARSRRHFRYMPACESEKGTRPPPAGRAPPPPLQVHAGLRERERDEHADHVERDERVGVAAEDDDQHRG